MSKTDKTKPFWVKLKDGDLRAVEFHNHDDGVCDLPDEIDADYWRTRCHYSFAYTGIGTCGCWMCRSYDWPLDNRQANRKLRRQRRAQNRHLTKGNYFGGWTVELD